MATAFTRLLGEQANVSHTTTFNSAGFTPGSELVFSNLAGLLGPGYGNTSFPGPADPAQTNAFAVNGLSFTT